MKQAKLYLSPDAFGEYYSRLDNGEMKYIGLAGKYAFDERLQQVYGRCDIDENIMIFTGVSGDYPRPSGNGSLFVNAGNEYILDDFNTISELKYRINSAKIPKCCVSAS